MIGICMPTTAILHSLLLAGSSVQVCYHCYLYHFLYLRRTIFEKPIILLDDVFSELDDAHQRHLLSAVEGYHVLLTGAHLPKRSAGESDGVGSREWEN